MVNRYISKMYRGISSAMQDVSKDTRLNVNTQQSAAIPNLWKEKPSFNLENLGREDREGFILMLIPCRAYQFTLSAYWQSTRHCDLCISTVFIISL